jgi:hypothetical protein
MFPTHDTIFTITGGSNTNFKIKRQRKDYYHQVNHVAIEGRITQTKWSHMTITFSSRDVNLTSFSHTDAMVVTVHIDRWDVTKILIDNDSQAEEEQTKLLSFLDKNSDVFAWSTFDSVGVSRDVIEHRQQVNPSARLKK